MSNSRQYFSLAVCLFTAGAVHHAAADDNLISGSIDAGIMDIYATETVHSGSFKISELDWETKNVPVLRGSLGIEIAPEWQLKVNGRVGFKGDGKMTDYDWISPYYIDTSKSGWSDRSIHPDTGLDHFYSGGIEINRKFVDDPRNTLSGGIGVKYTDLQWTSRGGSYLYSTTGTRDTSGTFTDGEKVITYRQQIPTAYAHIDGSRKFGRLSIDGGLEGGFAFAAKATDNHWLRDLEFTDEFDFAPTFGASLGASYTLTPKASLYLTANYDFTNLGRGDTKTYNTSTGVRNSYDEAAGATLRTIYVGAGLKGSF
ncbi:omptin family outer membrane protease [Agrobacterium sp. ES01]|uniref:omptin family outer membrane protease n=1 Tax=Agrobacterium sp. ES01 TaxID=3420714 RepID=UPI003D097F30